MKYNYSTTGDSTAEVLEFIKLIYVGGRLDHAIDTRNDNVWEADWAREEIERRKPGADASERAILALLGTCVESMETSFSCTNCIDCDDCINCTDCQDVNDAAGGIGLRGDDA